MANRYTTDDLILRTKRFYAATGTVGTYTDADVIHFLNEELQRVIAPEIMFQREDYLVKFVDVAMPATEADTILIPYRAMGTALREISLVDLNGLVLSNVTRVMPEQLDVGVVRRGIRPMFSIPQFYILGNLIHFRNPTPSISNTRLRLYYIQRPSDLVLETAAGKITSFNATTKEITVGAVPGTFSTAAKFDIVQGLPGFEMFQSDKTITTIVSNALTFTDDLPPNLAIGDYVCIAGQSPVAAVPLEYHDLLAQGAAMKILEALGNSQAVSLMMPKYQQYMESAARAIRPRVIGEPKVFSTAKGCW